AGTALRPRDAVDAAARRSVRCARVGPDARARRPPSARLRSRLRPLRSRRLAGAPRDDRRQRRRARARHARARRTARAVPARAGGGRRHDPDRLGGRGRRRRPRMKRFAELFAAVDGTTSTNAKVEAVVRYLRAAPPADAAWAVFFLT